MNHCFLTGVGDATDGFTGAAGVTVLAGGGLAIFNFGVFFNYFSF